MTSIKQRFTARPATALLAALSMLVLSGCDDELSSPQARRATAAVAETWVMSSSGDNPAEAELIRQHDIAITSNIEARFQNGGGLNVSDIDIDTSSGRVVLRGYVSGEAARERATQLAKGVDGVVSVDNLLHLRA